jgi:hypothetical protein
LGRTEDFSFELVEIGSISTPLYSLPAAVSKDRHDRNDASEVDAELSQNSIIEIG